jgi:hypothetical protein
MSANDDDWAGMVRAGTNIPAKPPDTTAVDAAKLAELEAELAKTCAKIIELDKERCALIGQLEHGAPLVCPCGELIYSWSPEVEAIHQEHVLIVGLDKLVR